MRAIILGIAVGAAVVLPACGGARQAAGTTAAAAAASHEGVYEFRAEMPGAAALPGRIVVRRDGAGYAGAIETEAFPPIPVVSVEEADGQVRIVGRTAEADIVFRLRFEGSDFAGEWQITGAEGGRVTGSRRPLP